MVICFAGILQNTCCNRINENKQKKKHCIVCGVFTQFCAFTYIESHASDRVCFTANTQMTNFSFQVLVRRRSLFFIFFGLYLKFFAWGIIGKTSFLGAPLQDRTSFFLCPWSTFLGCVLEETYGTTNLEAGRDF